VVTKITMYVQKGNQKPVWIPKMTLEDPKTNIRMIVPNETTYLYQSYNPIITR